MRGLLDRSYESTVIVENALQTPEQQYPVDSLSEYSAEMKYGVEMHQRRKKKTRYRIL